MQRLDRLVSSTRLEKGPRESWLELSGDQTEALRGEDADGVVMGCRVGKEAASVYQYDAGKTCVRAWSRAARDCLSPAEGCETKHGWCLRPARYWIAQARGQHDGSLQRRQQ